MRKIFGLWACALGCGSYVASSGSESTPDLPAAEKFQARSSVLEAVEGGPLVIKVTLKYTGAHAREVTSSSLYPSPFFGGTPPEWGMGIFVSGGGGLCSRDGRDCFTRIKPHEEWTKVYYLHHRYHNIASGRLTLKLRWTVRDPDTPDEKIIARPEVPLAINIEPADAKHLSALRARLEHRLEVARRSGDGEAIGEVLKYMDCTNHAALVPFAWRIIGQDRGNRRMTAIWFVGQHSEDLPAADLRLSRLLGDLELAERVELVRCWAMRGRRISPDAFQVLTNSADLWDRLLAYAYLSKLCDQRWVNKLLADLPKLTQPLSRSQFHPLLRELDDDEFAVREAATVQLTALGERVQAQLKGTLKTPLSLEAKRRVRMILERIAVAKGSLEWEPIFSRLSLGDGDSDAALLAIFRALAKGRPDAALTKAAVAHLDKLSTRK